MAGGKQPFSQTTCHTSDDTEGEVIKPTLEGVDSVT